MVHSIYILPSPDLVRVDCNESHFAGTCLDLGTGLESGDLVLSSALKQLLPQSLGLFPPFAGLASKCRKHLVHQGLDGDKQDVHIGL